MRRCLRRRNPPGRQHAVQEDDRRVEEAETELADRRQNAFPAGDLRIDERPEFQVVLGADVGVVLAVDEAIDAQRHEDRRAEPNALATR